MVSQQVLAVLLRAILAAKRSKNFYPEGSKLAGTWAPRFRRSIHDALGQGLTFPISVGRDRFLWSGGELLTSDEAIEALRFDFQSRGIVWFHIDPAVVDFELRAFLELLCLPPEQLSSVVGAPAYLRGLGVVNITVGTPSLTGDMDRDNTAVGASEDEVRERPNTAPPPMDSLEAFADSILASIDEYFKELVYDRSRLVAWFTALFNTGGLDALYAGARMLGATDSVDREVRLRTILEAIFKLPDTVFGPFIGDRLIPMSPYDLVAFNLLTQITQEELRRIALHVPQEKLIALSTDLVEFPWEAGKRQRLVEAVTWTLHQQSSAPQAQVHALPLPPDDPMLVELREEIITSSHKEILLERSVKILLFLAFDDTSANARPRAIAGLSEALHEALSLKMPDLCLHIFREVIARTSEGPPDPEMDAPIAEFKRKAADPALLALIAEPLRGKTTPEQIDTAAEYLRQLGETGIEGFTELLANEANRRVRMRMCDVLTQVGPSAIATLGEHASDPRWFMARNALYTLGKIGKREAAAAVTVALEHPHPRVRIEAMRAALLIDRGGATDLILRRIQDPEPTVRLAAINLLNRKGIAGAVPALRTAVFLPIQDQADWDIKSEAINALITIGTPEARAVLQEVAGRHTRFWARDERRLNNLARQALMRLEAVETATQGRAP